MSPHSELQNEVDLAISEPSGSAPSGNNSRSARDPWIKAHEQIDADIFDGPPTIPDHPNSIPQARTPILTNAVRWQTTGPAPASYQAAAILSRIFEIKRRRLVAAESRSDQKHFRRARSLRSMARLWVAQF
jgi:hypothetical protein